MLGTTFDSLKQRDRIRKIRRLTAAVSSALLLTGLFSVYAVIQGQRIRAELQRTQTAQSRYLAKQSETLLKEGDRVKALQLSLAALPADPAAPERPVVPEAVRALKEASFSYRMPNPGRFLPSLTLDPKHPVSGKAPAVNASGTFCALIDVSGRLCVFDTESGLLKAAFRPADLDSTAAGDQFLHAVFSGEDRLFAASADRIFCTDPSDGSLLWKMPFSRGTESEQAGSSPEDLLDPRFFSPLMAARRRQSPGWKTGLGFIRSAPRTELRFTALSGPGKNFRCLQQPSSVPLSSLRTGSPQRSGSPGQKTFFPGIRRRIFCFFVPPGEHPAPLPQDFRT